VCGEVYWTDRPYPKRFPAVSQWGREGEGCEGKGEGGGGGLAEIIGMVLGAWHSN